MPTFGEHPFKIPSHLPPPPGLDPDVAAAIVVWYQDIVNRAQAAMETLQMEDNMETGKSTEFTMQQIRAFQMGAMMAVAVVGELHSEFGLINSDALNAYLLTLAPKA